MSGPNLETEKQVVAYALNELDKDNKYVGILLCEGVFGGIDANLYQAMYPQFLVIPVAGCDHVIQFIPSVQKRLHDYQVCGIVDRDSRSKREIRELEKQGVYSTKLPFIENVICAPEVVRFLAPIRGYNSEEVIEKIGNNLFYHLCNKIRDSLPINVPFVGGTENSASINIRILINSGEVIEKMVDKNNIIYAYRNKCVANEAAFVLGLKGKTKYYEFFNSCLHDADLKDTILKIIRRFLPVIHIETEQQDVEGGVNENTENSDMNETEDSKEK